MVLNPGHTLKLSRELFKNDANPTPDQFQNLWELGSGIFKIFLGDSNIQSRLRIVDLEQCLPDLNIDPDYLKGLLKTQIASLHPRLSDSFRSGWGPRILFSNKFLGDVDALCDVFSISCDNVGPTPWEPLTWNIVLERNLKPNESSREEGNG